MAKETDETEDKQFEALLLEKRHKELLKSLKDIALGFAQNNDDALLKLIAVQGDKLELLSKSLTSFKLPDTEIIFKTDEMEVFFEGIKAEIISSNEKLIAVIQDRLLPHTFDLQRDYGGFTTSVKINYKPAKEIR